MVLTLISRLMQCLQVSPQTRCFLPAYPHCHLWREVTMHSPHSRRESCNLSPRRKYKITSINYLELFCRDVSFMPHFIIHLYWFEPIDIYFAFCIINPILYFVAQTVLALAIENSLCGILSPCTVGCVLCVCVCMAVYTCAS